MVFHPAAAIISQMLNVKTQNLNLQKKQKNNLIFIFTTFTVTIFLFKSPNKYS